MHPKGLHWAVFCCINPPGKFNVNRSGPMFKPVELQIKNVKTAFDLISYGIATKRQELKLARAIIESKNAQYPLNLLELEGGRKIELSPTWRRRAIQAVLEKGKPLYLKRCLLVLPKTVTYEGLRAPLLEKLLTRGIDVLFDIAGTDVKNWLFWGKGFLASEAHLIVMRVLTLNDPKFAELLLHNSASSRSGPFLSEEDRQILLLLAVLNTTETHPNPTAIPQEGP